MILDVTGAILRPGNEGRDCLANGEHAEVECACDECDYLMCCWERHDPTKCGTCVDSECPHAMKNRIGYRLK